MLTSPTIQLGVWTAAFAAMASFLSALGLGEVEAAALAAWLRDAVEMGTILLGGHRHGDHLLLREVSHPVLAPLALTDRLQEFQQAPLFTAFLASVEQAISDIQMQSAMHPESAGFVFDLAGFASSSGDP